MRYRKWIMPVFLLAVLLSLTLSVHAAGYSYVFDEADILTGEEERMLEETAADISARYGCGVYIVTVWDFQDYGSSVRSGAEDYFLSHDFGIGSGENGVMLLLSMAERDYALIAHGDMGNRAFTDYGKDVLSEKFLDDFRSDSWFGGFADYLSGSDAYLDACSAGEPVDVGQESGGLGMTLVMVLVIPVVIAFAACGIMASSMKTARSKTDADDYQKGVHLTNRQDRFITRTVVRQKIESDSHSGGTHVNSGGFSGKSGKF